jgi:hypothetical protein
MEIKDFLDTVYLGDRGCMMILIDGWNSEVKIQVTCISRVRGDKWNFYDAEDLKNGFLVFEGVKSVELSPRGLIPNDLINEIIVEKHTESPELTTVVISVDSVDDNAQRSEVNIKIVAKSLALEAENGLGGRIRH